MRHDLTSLKLFIAVAECGNLTRAAEREHLAVSAVSKRIAELESLIGTTLLQRQARGVSLTPAGQSLLHHARQLMQLVQRMDAELGEYAEGVKGHVRLHVVASALTQFLPEEVESFLGRYPMVNVEMIEQTGKAIVQAVSDGQADIGVVAAQTPTFGLATFPYHQDRLVVGIPLGHPLARRKSVRFSEIASYPFIGPHASSSLAGLLAQAAKECNVTLHQRVQASSFDAMCRLVETRLGITVLPDGVLAPFVKARRIGVVALKEPWAQRQLCVIVRDPMQLSPIAKTLLDHLVNASTNK
jgi:DNA-binding transcriptional LysR family regulator